MKKIKTSDGEGILFLHLTKTFRIMKIFAVFMMCALVQVSAATYSQTAKLTLNLRDVTLADLFTKIEQTSEFHFFYDSSELDLSRMVTVNTENTGIESILKEVFRNSDLTYEVYDRYIIIKSKSRDEAAPASVSSQQPGRVISGKVTDIKKLPIPGVTVIIKGTTRGTITNEDGEFSFDNIPQGAELHFSFVGMKPMDLEVGNQSRLNVTLQEETIGLEEVVAIGYGVQKKSDITGAVASVSSADLNKIATSTPVQALQGKAAGVSVIMESGSPDATASIKIRGVGTTNNTDPLYVVDGLPMSDIDYLNSNDIESIEILKDASACAIYGSRGANGVVLITTKKGKEGTLDISFNAYYGMETMLNAPEMLNAGQYAELSNLAYTNAGGTPPYSNTNPPFNTNWYDEVSRIGTVENYNLSFTGGSERINSFLSGNYFTRKGIIKSTDFEKLSFIQNSAIKATDFLRIETSLSGTFTKSSRMDPTSIFLSSLIAPPDIPVMDPETDYFSGIHKLRLTNPAGRVARNNSENGTTNLVGNVTANLTLLKGLVFKSVFGLRYLEGRSSDFEPVYYETADISTLISTVNRSSSRSTDWTWDNILTWNKKFGDNHELTAMGAISAREYNFDTFSASKQNVTIEDREFWYFDAATTNPQNSGSGASLAMLSYLGRVNYNLMGRYLFTGSFRADGSSRFLSNNRWGYFPSGAIAWKVSEENFFKSLGQNVVSSMKLRVGYGEIGNENINSFYPYLTPIRQQQYYTIGESQARVNGAGNASLGNPAVQWETSKQTNLGIDLMFLEGKLSSTVDYYIRKTDNILLSQQVPRISGSNSITRNVGGMENRGVELTVNYKENRKAFKYDISANVATVKNEVTSLGTSEALISSFAYDYVLIDFQGAFGSIIRSVVGRPYGQFYGWRTDGIFQNQSEIDNYLFNGTKIQPTAKPGDFKFQDLNNDGKINDSDKDYIGSPIPNLTFGLTFNASYKRFDMSLSFQGQAGNDIYNAAKYYFMKFDGRQNVRTGLLDNYWKGENTSNTQPIITQNLGRNDANFRNSDFYIEDGSYVRLRNVQVGYNFSPVVTSTFKPDCRLYVSAQNLLTLTGYSGFEPEVSGIGVDRGVYPQSTSFMVGTVINF